MSKVWVTMHGTDPLLPAEENCATFIEPPTASEMNHAITGNMENLLVKGGGGPVALGVLPQPVSRYGGGWVGYGSHRVP